MIITGASGFIGQNVIKYFGEVNNIYLSRNSIDSNYSQIDSLNLEGHDVFLHLAGLAHDVKNASSPDEYYRANTDLTKIVFDAFLASDAKVFIMLSSVKAVADDVTDELTEDYTPNPVTHYGKSKLLAEQYIFSKILPAEKRVYVLRPCMIHGEGNRGNLNLLHKIVSINFPWPLGVFKNKRSFCSVDNLMFLFEEFMNTVEIPSGIYNVADDEPLSTIDIISLIAESKGRAPIIWNIPSCIVLGIARIGDLLHLPLNSERLQKLTSSYVVSNKKIRSVIAKSLPLSSREGFLKTFESFNKL